MIDSKEFRFEASHILPRHKGKCSRLHGHSWKLIVFVKGDIDPETGFVIDFSDLKEIVQPLIDALDHRHLGSWDVSIFNRSYVSGPDKVVGLPWNFYPSSENLLVWIGDQLDSELKWWRLELDETCTSKAILTREDYEIIVRNRSQNVSTEESRELHKTDEEKQVLQSGQECSKKEVGKGY